MLSVTVYIRRYSQQIFWKVRIVFLRQNFWEMVWIVRSWKFVLRFLFCFKTSLRLTIGYDFFIVAKCLSGEQFQGVIGGLIRKYDGSSFKSNSWNFAIAFIDFFFLLKWYHFVKGSNNALWNSLLMKLLFFR